MKTKLMLLLDADADSAGVVLEAAARSGHAVRLVKTSRDAFDLLKKGLHIVDVVIVDVDPGAHGMALLEAISGCEEKPPMLVLSSLEEAYMKSVAARHGAAACLGKPLSVARLRSALDRL
jgi:DNA-binding response OmpR family regulator